MTTRAIGGNRLEWAHVPARVRDAVEMALGSTVVAARTQPGGFSPGLAARVRLADGRRAFVKAVGIERNPVTPDLLRAEADVVARLPDGLAPGLLAVYDDGDWVALVFEDVEGRTPGDPWTDSDWRRVHDGLVAHLARRTPTPIALPPIEDVMADDFVGWRSLDPDTLDPWSRANLDRLIDLESSWADAARGDTLLHLDTRADNLLLTETELVVVDWPHATVGAAWVDLLVLLPSVAMQGGPDPVAVWARSPLARTADPDAVTSVLAAVAGFFLNQSTRPPVPGLGPIRAFQRGQGEAALRWLRSR